VKDKTLVDLSKYRSRLRDLDLRPFRGTVVHVAGMRVESQGPPVGVGRLCEIHLANGRRVPAEVVAFRDRDRILLPLEKIDGISPGDAVVAHATPRQVRLGDDLLGRVLDGLGRPMDGGDWPEGHDERPLDNGPPSPMRRVPITQPLPFGIRAFDGLLTAGKGQRLGIFSGSGVGKSTLLGEIARSSQADVNVVALIGERGREVRQFLDESLGPEGLAKSVVVAAPADVSPIQRVKAAFTAITIAEFFRDRNRDVVLMMDSMTRLAQAQREIGLAAGEPPATKGYCPSVFALLPQVTERLGQTETGSITGIFTVLVEGDDLSDPIADAARSLLDGHVVLSRRLAEQGHHPAVDILQSVSRLMPAVTGEHHLAAAQRFKAIYATYAGAEDLINIGAFVPGSNRRIDKALSLIDQVNAFLIQPLGAYCDFETTVTQMCEITETWDFLSPDV